MKKKNYLLLATGLTVAAISIYVLGGWGHKKHHEEHHGFLVTNPWRETISIDKEYVAQIHAIQHIELRSYEKGYLQNIYVNEGQLVKKGQKMFQIMPLLMEAEFNKAKAEYDLARIEYNNTSILEKQKVVSVNELALAKARLDKAKAVMDLAQTHLKFATINAPFDGLMDRFQVRLGSLVDEGELLTTLSDNSKMWVYFNVSEADYLQYMKQKKGNISVPVKLKLANGDIFPHEGEIDTIEADFDNSTGNVAFRATFPNPDGLLRQGETGNIILTNVIEDALVIPQKATFEVLDKKFVYEVDANNQLQSQQISILEEVPHLFIVKSGLYEKDMILLEGLSKVKLHDKIKPVYQKHDEVMAGLKLSVK